MHGRSHIRRNSAPVPEPAALRRKVLPLRQPGSANRGSNLLVAEHLLAAGLYLLAGSAGLIWIAPSLSNATFVFPPVVGVTHLFTLGWLTMTIFGVLFQIIPRALHAMPGPTWVGHLGFWLFAPGVALFAAGVAMSAPDLRHVGIALVAPGVLVTLGNLAVSVLHSSERDVTRAAVLLALFFLFSTLVLGVFLLVNLRNGFLAESRLRVLGAHLHLALVGWALMMVVGVSHRILPAVLASAGSDSRWTARSLMLLSVGVVGLSAGFLLPAPAIAWIGAVALESGVACFLLQAFEFYRNRTRSAADVGLAFAASGLTLLVVSAVVGAILMAAGGVHPRVATIYVVIGLPGALTLYVIGHLYRIVPNFVPSALSRRRVRPVRTQPGVKLFSERWAGVQLVGMVSGVVLLAAGVATDAVVITRAGSVLYLGGTLIMLGQMWRVVRAAMARV